MTDNVINATSRFGQERPRGYALETGEKVTLLDRVASATRIRPEDRVTIATRLGELAVRQNPARPQDAVREWFNSAWSGDRWDKRKRYVILPGEVAGDPHVHGTYVAVGRDWAALIRQAAAAEAAGEGAVAEAVRSRMIRDILRGTAFVSALDPVPKAGDSVQEQMALFADRVGSLLNERSGIERLWSVLDVAPFEIGVSSPDQTPDEPAFVTETRKFAYSMGADPDEMGWQVGFTSAPNADTAWANPSVLLGYRAHRRQTRMFVVPQDFIRELPAVFDLEDFFEPGEHLLQWLIVKGLMKGEAFERLPDISFSAKLGFGWQTFDYERVQGVYVEARAKPDGSSGLWVHAVADDSPHYHPVLFGFDAVALEQRRLFFSECLEPSTYWSRYEFIWWPTEDERYMPGGKMPYGAASGLIEPEYEELPEVTGWLDDTGNAELQDLLLGSPDRVRFVPRIATAPGAAVPCRAGTVAATILANLAARREDTIAQQLLAQAQIKAEAGLAYHEAVLDHNRNLIDAIGRD